MDCFAHQPPAPSKPPPWRGIGALLAFCCALIAQGAASVQETRDLAYGPHPRHRLDLCWPASGAAPFPAVLLIHGGGWTTGDKADFAWLCRFFAERGIVAASVDYRLADGSPDGAWPAQLVDVQLAVRWLRAHARELRIDPAHICALGDSAGGQLATWLAVEKSIHPGDFAREFGHVSPAVACAVDNFGPMLFEESPFDRVATQLFAPGSERRARELSPLPKISASTAPALIAHGRQDAIVPLAHSRKLAEALESAHVPTALLIFEGGHEFQGLGPKARDEILAAEAEFIRHAGVCDDAAPRSACAWLGWRGAPEGTP